MVDVMVLTRGVPRYPGDADGVFALAEQRIPHRLQVLCIRPDPSPELIESLRRPSVSQALLVDDSPDDAVAVYRLVEDTRARHLDVLCADLFASGTYEGRVPSDVIVLGTRLTTASEARLQAFVEALPRLCSRDALVAWPAETLSAARRSTLDRMLHRAGFDGDPAPEEARWHHALHVGVAVRLEGPRL